MFKVSWSSCEDAAEIFNVGHKIVALNHNATFTIGDSPYMNSDAARGGITPVTLDKDSSTADILTHYTAMWAGSGWAQLAASDTEVYMMMDDHEWMGDNWDGTITQANAGAAGLALADNITGQGEANTHHSRCREAWKSNVSTYADNPANIDATAVNDIAPAATTHGATPSASDYDPIYYRVGFDIDGNVSTTPHVEFFVLDCISHRSTIAATDNAAKSMLGLGTGDDRATDGQYHWLTTQLLASTATFKVIMSPKKTYKNAAADNTDTWGEYDTELQLILAYIDTNSITGVLWVAGDRHNGSVIKTSKTDGDTYDHLCVVACPSGVAVLSGGMSLSGNHVQNFQGTYDQNFGELVITEDYIDIRIRSAHEIDRIMWQGRLLAGENRLDETKQKVAI